MLKFTRQKPIGNFIADFYCSELLLVIEVDGDTHANQEAYDELRSEILSNKYNIEVIRYSNDEVLKNIEGVYTDLIEKIKKRKQYIQQTPHPPLSGGGKRWLHIRNKESDFDFLRNYQKRFYESPPVKGDEGGSDPTRSFTVLKTI